MMIAMKANLIEQAAEAEGANSTEPAEGAD